MTDTMTKKKTRKDLRTLLPDKVVDELLVGCTRPEDLTGKDGLLAQLTKRLVERALGAELTHHLGYAPGGAPGADENCRNGYSEKTLVGEHGTVGIDVPRDRAGAFEPQLVRKHQKRFAGFDQKIIAMYARGLSVREIQALLEEQYQVAVSPDLISQVTAGVLEEVQAWQSRPLESVYPVVFLDALRVKMRDEGVVSNKAVHLALAIREDGTREVLGLWIEQNEGAKFWLRVLNELQHRGVTDILLAVVDGLKGFPEAIASVYPQTTVQTCIVHLLRSSLAYVPWRDRRAVAGALKAIYRAENATAARARLDEFARSEWARRYPTIVPSWERAWEYVTPFLSYAAPIRKIIYTTNAIESLHMRLRKILKTRGHFPNDEAATKLIYLALRNVTATWKNPPLQWRQALTQLAITFPNRLKAAS
jgi:transposase-like protein